MSHESASQAHSFNDSKYFCMLILGLYVDILSHVTWHSTKLIHFRHCCRRGLLGWPCCDWYQSFDRSGRCFEVYWKLELHYWWADVYDQHTMLCACGLNVYWIIPCMLLCWNPNHNCVCGVHSHSPHQCICTETLDQGLSRYVVVYVVEYVLSNHWTL